MIKKVEAGNGRQPDATISCPGIGSQTRGLMFCRRQGKQEVKVTVEVEAEGEKELCELAKPLADLLGIRHESRTNILQALFTYIRLHKLQVGLLLH